MFDRSKFRPSARLIIVALLTQLAWSLGAPHALADVPAALRDIARPLLSSPDARPPDPILAAIATWYDERSYAPAWLSGNKLSPRGEAVVTALGKAASHGLDPTHYHLSTIELARIVDNDVDRARLDWLISRALLSFAADLSVGRVNPATIDANMQIEPRRPDYARLLRSGTESPDVASWIESQAPSTREYVALRRALATYREKAASEPFTRVPDAATLLRPGQREGRVSQIRQRLGELEGVVVPTPTDDPLLYDEPLVSQVKAYQARLGLTVDGIIGPRTVESLNSSAIDRVNQIIVNLERRRWYPEAPGPRYVKVNSAHHSMIFVDDSRLVFETRVIVGTPKDPTPEITSLMRGFQTNPYWTVPPSIAGEEYLPLLRRDPTALQKQGMKIFASWSDDNSEIDPSAIDWTQINPKAFPYRVRQEPGPGNALGYIFFPFTNKYGIYMHDTASRGLFSEGSRNFSHGCIRVQNPVDFVLAVYRGRGGMTRERIDTAIQSQSQAGFSFPEPVPLQVVYHTVIARSDGGVEFRDDVYGRDRKVLRALAAAK